MSDPIEIPVVRKWDDGHGSYQQIDGYLHITSDIHAQILAPLAKRVGALERGLRHHGHYETEEGTLVTVFQQPEAGWQPQEQAPPAAQGDDMGPVNLNGEKPDHFAIPKPFAQDDEATVEDDLAAAISAAHDGPLSDDHVRTLLYYLRRDAAEIAALKAQVATPPALTICDQCNALAEQRDALTRDNDDLRRRLAETEASVEEEQLNARTLVAERDAAIEQANAARQDAEAARAEAEKWKVGGWDTIVAIGTAMGLAAPDMQADALAPEWRGKMSEKVRAIVADAEAARRERDVALDEAGRATVHASNHAADAETARRERDATAARADQLAKELEAAKKDASNCARMMANANRELLEIRKVFDKMGHDLEKFDTPIEQVQHALGVINAEKARADDLAARLGRAVSVLADARSYVENAANLHDMSPADGVLTSIDAVLAENREIKP